MEKLPETALEYHHYTLGKILFYLADQGLRRLSFEPADAMAIVGFPECDDVQVIDVFHDVLFFMMNEQIIRVASYKPRSSGYSFRGVQLTAKGLQLIQAEPSKLGHPLRGSIAANTAADEDQSQYEKWGAFAGNFIAKRRGAWEAGRQDGGAAGCRHLLGSSPAHEGSMAVSDVSLCGP